MYRRTIPGTGIALRYRSKDEAIPADAVQVDEGKLLTECWKPGQEEWLTCDVYEDPYTKGQWIRTPWRGTDRKP